MPDKARNTEKLLSLLKVQNITQKRNELEAMSVPLFEVADGLDALPAPNKARMAELLEQPERATELVEALQERLQQTPRIALDSAPALLGASPTLTDGFRLLDNARHALAQPELTFAALEANRTDSAPVTTSLESFPGRDDAEIPIIPGMRKFETVADAHAWALTAAYAWGFRMANSKPACPPHTTSSSSFRYPLKTVGDKATVALFSDWGTGYYYSQYIAKHVADMNVMQAIHLGDVYYTGTQQEFSKQFEPILDRYILKRMPFFAMNANHEMDTHGIAYFSHLRRKRQQGGQNGYVEQPQEGSYFCLDNDHYQIIGIDTAYWKNGRCEAGLETGCDMMRNWLEQRLRQGRAAGKINILLSQNEPYELKEQDLLEDLGFILHTPQRSLVDLWFWGDQHYCALYPPTAQTPFIGSCIGHGGYPYSVKTRDWFSRHHVKPAWGETAPRFPQRPDRGNNGFCLLEAEPGQLRLRYIDWRRNDRCTVTIPVNNNRLDWARKSSVECDQYSS